MGCSKNSGKREVYSNINLPQKMRKTSNKQFNLISKATRKRRRRRRRRRKTTTTTTTTKTPKLAGRRK